MTCSSCNDSRILSVSAKCSDLCTVKLDGKTLSGYVPHELGIGGGDYVEFKLCLTCGRIQDSFPKFGAQDEISDDPPDCPDCNTETEWVDTELVRCNSCQTEWKPGE